MSGTAPKEAGAARPLLGFGRVWHRRLRPAAHAFSHSTCFFMLPMRALRSRPDDRLRRNRFGALAFFDRDHGDGRDDALEWLDELLASEGVHDAQGEVWLHTYPRLLGRVFKPVSFWFAHRRDGSLTAVVAEVNNTFGERHCYLLSGRSLRWGAAIDARKVLHVSPFCEIEGHYRFSFRWNGEAPDRPRHVAARIDYHDAAGPLLHTSIAGTLQPMTAAAVGRAFICALPLLGFGVIARIHWQALRLVLKRVPFHRQPAAPDRFVTR